jgi:hypothetical protein
MKIYRKETSLDISELNLNDYYLILGMIDAIHKLVSDNELSSFIDNQEKEKLQEDVERILFELSKERGIKIAESQAETIIRKVIEKATKN